MEQTRELLAASEQQTGGVAEAEEHEAKAIDARLPQDLFYLALR